MGIALRRCLALAAVALALAPSPALAQDSKSTALVAELTRLLDEAKLDSVAAMQAPSQYVGALYYPGSQLLVIGAKYDLTARFDQLTKEKNYRDIYVDLSSATDPKTRLFVMDLGANGLKFKRENNQPFDTADLAGRSIIFDGDWGKAKISEAEYRKTYETTDQQYSQMLQALIAALKK